MEGKHTGNEGKKGRVRGPLYMHRGTWWLLDNNGSLSMVARCVGVGIKQIRKPVEKEITNEKKAKLDKLAMLKRVPLGSESVLIKTISGLLQPNHQFRTENGRIRIFT